MELTLDGIIFLVFLLFAGFIIPISVSRTISKRAWRSSDFPISLKDFRYDTIKTQKSFKSIWTKDIDRGLGADYENLVKKCNSEINRKIFIGICCAIAIYILALRTLPALLS